MEKLSRRKFNELGLKTAAAIFLSSPALKVRTVEAAPRDDHSSDTHLQRLTDRFIEVASEIGVDNLGYITTKPYQFDGLWHLGFQFGVLQDSPDKIRPLNLCDVFNQRQLDDDLESGKYGIFLPKHVPINDNDLDFETKNSRRIELLKTPSRFVNHANDLRKMGFEVGVPTSLEKIVGRLRIIRFQMTAFQEDTDTGQIQPVLVGDAAKKAGLIPQESFIDNPMEIPQKITIKSSEGECHEAGSFIGVGSFYTRNGCLGCGRGAIMANGEPLNDSALTLAYWRAPLNSYVRITNLDTGISVIARVTDRGGFDGAYNPYPNLVSKATTGRIFDLSLALKNSLGNFATDRTRLQITQLTGPGCINTN